LLAWQKKFGTHSCQPDQSHPFRTNHRRRIQTASLGLFLCEFCVSVPSVSSSCPFSMRPGDLCRRVWLLLQLSSSLSALTQGDACNHHRINTYEWRIGSPLESTLAEKRGRGTPLSRPAFRCHGFPASVTPWSNLSGYGPRFQGVNNLPDGLYKKGTNIPFDSPVNVLKIKGIVDIRDRAGWSGKAVATAERHLQRARGQARNGREGPRPLREQPPAHHTGLDWRV